MASRYATAARLLRRAPDRTLTRRDDAGLPFVTGQERSGRRLLLDTNVYLLRGQGKLPPEVSELLEKSVLEHSTIAMQELMHSVGALDPGHPDTEGVLAAIEIDVNEAPSHRMHAPDEGVALKAAVLAGMLCRSQRYADDSRLRAVNDAVLGLQARQLGCTLLTANVKDFDLLQQLEPTMPILLFRPT